jgi:selenide,water dikinase
MRAVNGTVAAYLGGFQVNAATDITGYGLIGHAWEMAVGSGVSLVLVAEEIPILAGTLALAREGMLPASIQSNREYLAGQIEWTDTDELAQAVLFDPQTSGGLLLSLPAAEAHKLCHKFDVDGIFVRRIGTVQPSGEKPITVRGNLTQD